MRADPPAESLAGHYAGPVTRLAAYAIDAFASVASYGLLLSLIAFSWQLIGRNDLTLPAENSILWLVGLGVWGFLYFWGSWALAAKSPGMAVLGLPAGVVILIVGGFMMFLGFMLIRKIVDIEV